MSNVNVLLRDLFMCVDSKEKQIMPMIPYTSVCYVYDHRPNLAYTYDDKIVFINERYKFIREFSVPALYESLLPYLYSEEAVKHFRKKDDYLSNRIPKYNKLSHEERINLYESSEYRHIMKPLWNEFLNVNKEFLNFIHMSLFVPKSKKNEHDYLNSENEIRERLYTPVSSYMSKKSFGLVRRRLIQDMSYQDFEYFLPIMRELGFQFPFDEEPSIENAYFTLARVYSDEIIKNFDGRMIIAPRDKTDSDKFEDDIPVLQQENRYYMSYREGLFYVYDSKKPNYNIGLSEFLKIVVSELTRNCLDNNLKPQRIGEDVNTKEPEFKFYSDIYSSPYINLKSFLADKYGRRANPNNIEDIEPYWSYVNVNMSLEKALHLKKVYEDCLRERDLKLHSYSICNSPNALIVIALCWALTDKMDAQALIDLIPMRHYNFRDDVINNDLIVKNLEEEFTGEVPRHVLNMLHWNVDDYYYQREGSKVRINRLRERAVPSKDNEVVDRIMKIHKAKGGYSKEEVERMLEEEPLCNNSASEKSSIENSDEKEEIVWLW